MDGWRLEFTPDGRCLLLPGEHVIRVYDVKCEAVVRELRDPLGDDAPVTSLSVSPDGVMLLAGSEADQHVRLWNLPNGRLVADLPIGGGTAHVSFAANGRSFAVASKSRTLTYEVNGLCEQTFAAIRPGVLVGAAVDPTGRSLAVAASEFGRRACEVTVWPVGDRGASAKPYDVREFAPFDPNDAAPLAFHPDALGLAFGSGAGRAVYLSTVCGEQDRSDDVPQAYALAFAHDGRLWGATNDEVRAWEFPGGRQVAYWSNAAAEKLSGLPQIYALAAGKEWVLAGGRDGCVHFMRADTGTRVASRRAAYSPIRSLALTSDGTMAVAGTESGELRVLTVPGGEVVSELAPHADRVTGLSFAGDLMASASRDCSVTLWRRDGQRLIELMTLPATGPVRGLSFFPDGRRLMVIVEKERAVRIWHLDRLDTLLGRLGLSSGLPPLDATASANPYYR
jgi:WD40 repeat protein